MFSSQSKTKHVSARAVSSSVVASWRPGAPRCFPVRARATRESRPQPRLAITLSTLSKSSSRKALADKLTPSARCPKTPVWYAGERHVYGAASTTFKV